MTDMNITCKSTTWPCIMQQNHQFPRGQSQKASHSTTRDTRQPTCKTYRFAAPPAGIGDRLLVAQRKVLVGDWVIHGVGDDAVGLGVEACDYGVVIREGLGGEGRMHHGRRDATSRYEE